MTDKVQPIIDAFRTALISAGFRYVEQYSVDAINGMGANKPAILLLPESIDGEMGQAEYTCDMSLKVIVYDNIRYNRIKNLTVNINKIKTALYGSSSLGGLICSVPSFTVDYGTDGTADDFSTAGQNGQETIGSITFILHYREDI